MTVDLCVIHTYVSTHKTCMLKCADIHAVRFLSGIMFLYLYIPIQVLTTCIEIVY